MSDIAGLEDVAGRTSVRVNGRTGFGWSIPPHIERAAAAREAKPIRGGPPSTLSRVSPSPKVTSMAAPEKSTPTVHIFPATEITCYSELINALKEQIGVMGV